MISRIAWIVSALVILVSLGAWGSMYEWRFAGMTSYQLFPLFGLLAFGLMWTHYIADATRKHLKQPKEALTDYFDVTSAAVLVLILAHPGLLVWQLWQDGHGLPPGSYKAYVGSTLYGFVILGVISLLAFLAYEFRNMLKKRTWKRAVQYASDIAMVLVLIHGFRLGSVVEGWFGTVWLVYGITFLLALGYVRFDRIQKT